jgi:arylsulfatase A-like enzyme
VSGQYPSSHQVWSFDDQLSDRPQLMTSTEEFGLFADTIWTDLPPKEKPPFRMIRAISEHSKEISDIDTPFVAIEHDRGGHLPYGRSFDRFDSTEEFFNSERPSLSELSDLYRRGVELAEKRFLERISQLKQRNLLDETLVIYTSDHGETLGEPEHGLAVGHGAPIVPDVVNVPIVFAGAGLPDAELSYPISGTDIAPTALSAIDKNIPERCDGYDLWEGDKKDKRCRSELWLHANTTKFGEIEKYRGSSVWDRSGGYVFQKGSRLSRVALASNTGLRQAPWSYLNRDVYLPYRLLKFLKIYLSATVQYGSPGFSEKEGRTEVVPFNRSNIENDTKIDRDQLRKLGYLE